jgi:hypothetical protein
MGDEEFSLEYISAIAASMVTQMQLNISLTG